MEQRNDILVELVSRTMERFEGEDRPQLIYAADEVVRNYPTIDQVMKSLTNAYLDIEEPVISLAESLGNPEKTFLRRAAATWMLEVIIANDHPELRAESQQRAFLAQESTHFYKA